MARETLAKAMPHVFKVEGGYVDHPRDPGGATNLGITIGTLRAWRKKPVTKADVRALTKAEATDIYKWQYWDKVSGDELPAGVDYAAFDFAINSGPRRAAQFLQSLVGVADDGVIGVITLNAVEGYIKRYSVEMLINAYMDSRLAWMKRLRTWSTFGRGWSRRISHVRAAALDFADDIPSAPRETPVDNKAPANEKTGDSPDVSVPEVVKDPTTVGLLTSLLTAIGTALTTPGPLQWAMAFVLVVSIVLVAAFVFPRIRKGWQ